jgi:hypothetical protein
MPRPSTLAEAGAYRLLLLVHILVTVGLFGADVVLITLDFSAVFGADPLFVYPAAQLIASSIIAPFAVISLASGVVLARVGGWGLFRYWWVTIKLAVTLVLTLVILTVLVPKLGIAANAATASSAFGFDQRIPLAAAPAAATLFLVLNVALAVYKPGWRLTPRRLTAAAHSA